MYIGVWGLENTEGYGGKGGIIGEANRHHLEKPRDRNI
jgi:hypothetical protein